MGRKRRQIGLHDPARWIFNRMADVYDARPAYPADLIDAIAQLAPGPRVADLGAGTGHLALPLAERGFEVVAVDPADAMLEVLRHSARERGVALTTLHAMAEALPFDAARFDLVVISDALHFLDTERAGAEIRRVLSARGVLVLVTSEFGPTPFMSALRGLMEEAAPRRPRDVAQAIRQLASLSQVELTHEAQFADETPVDPEQLERIVRSMSFIGPAMNALRFAAFRARFDELPQPAVWARGFKLHAGRRTRRP